MNPKLSQYVELVRTFLCDRFDEHPISYTAATIIVCAILAAL